MESIRDIKNGVIRRLRNSITNDQGALTLRLREIFIKHPTNETIEDKVFMEIMCETDRLIKNENQAAVFLLGENFDYISSALKNNELIAELAAEAISRMFGPSSSLASIFSIEIPRQPQPQYSQKEKSFTADDAIKLADNSLSDKVYEKLISDIKAAAESGQRFLQTGIFLTGSVAITKKLREAKFNVEVQPTFSGASKLLITW